VILSELLIFSVKNIRMLWQKIEDTRLMKGKGTPDWPYWCFLPVKCWMLLFMNKPGIAFTHQLWQEILTFSMLGT
jgi:hypothetical protein